MMFIGKQLIDTNLIIRLGAVHILHKRGRVGWGWVSQMLTFADIRDGGRARIVQISLM